MNYTEVVKKFDVILGRGLSKGLGNPNGQMCVEAAICAALDLPHGDNPKCVAKSVRRFKISLNDSDWSSTRARAKGLRDLGVAQLGSLGVVDDSTFTRLMTERVIRRLIPDLFYRVFPDNPDCLNAAVVCRQEGTIEAATAALAAHEVAMLSNIDFFRIASLCDDAAFFADDAIASIRCAHLSKPKGNYYLLMGAHIALDILKELRISWL